MHQRFFGLGVPQNYLISILIVLIFDDLVPCGTHEVVSDILRLLLRVLTECLLLNIPLKFRLGFGVQLRNVVNTRIILDDVDVLSGRLG